MNMSTFCRIGLLFRVRLLNFEEACRTSRAAIDGASLTTLPGSWAAPECGRRRTDGGTKGPVIFTLSQNDQFF